MCDSDTKVTPALLSFSLCNMYILPSSTQCTRWHMIGRPSFFGGGRPKSGDFDKKKQNDTKFNPFCCFFSYLAKRIKIHIFAKNLKNIFRMENCIFCDLIKENDPIKIPEQGKDYSIIKGMFIKGLKVRKRVLQLRNHWWLAIRIPTVKLKIPGKAFLKSESRTSVTFKL